MGIVVSCCCPQDPENSGHDEAYGDRSRLIGHDAGNAGLDSTENDLDASHDEGRMINGSVPTGGDFVYGNSKGASVPKAPIDENQAALQEILTSMTHDVMDAGMLDTAMEPADYQERAQEYGRRLKSAAHQLAIKYETKKSEGLVDAPRSSEEVEGSADLAETDAVLITEITSRAQESVGGLDFQIKNTEDLVAHFGDGNRISGDENHSNLGNGTDTDRDNAAAENEAASQ